MAKLTAEQACINYAVAWEADKKATAAIGSCHCELIDKYYSEGSNGVHPDSCLTQLFKSRGDEDAEPDELCEPCELALRLIEERKPIRAKFGAAKRNVLAVGKRLNVTEVSL